MEYFIGGCVFFGIMAVFIVVDIARGLDKDMDGY